MLSVPWTCRAAVFCPSSVDICLYFVCSDNRGQCQTDWCVWAGLSICVFTHCWWNTTASVWAQIQILILNKFRQTTNSRSQPADISSPPDPPPSYLLLTCCQSYLLVFSLSITHTQRKLIRPHWIGLQFCWRNGFYQHSLTGASQLQFISNSQRSVTKRCWAFSIPPSRKSAHRRTQRSSITLTPHPSLQTTHTRTHTHTHRSVWRNSIVCTCASRLPVTARLFPFLLLFLSSSLTPQRRDIVTLINSASSFSTSVIRYWWKARWGLFTYSEAGYRTHTCVHI